MSDKQRAQLAMMLRTGMMDQEDYNETIAAMDVRDAGRAPSRVTLGRLDELRATTLTCPNCGIPVQPEWKACPQCGTSLDGHLSYEEWLAQGDSKLMELGGFNLKHAKVMMPSLDMNRLFPGDETHASTPEETAQDIVTMIEGKV